MSTLDNFMARVAKSDRDNPSGCWSWTGALKAGAPLVPIAPEPGQPYVGQRSARVFIYTAKRGAIPPRHYLQAVCNNPVCVNPAHMTPVVKGSIKSKEN